MQYDDPIYGQVEFSGVVERVIQNPGMQRLKKVHQNGADFLVNPDMDTSRFEHSLGAAILCKRFGCSEDEVVAALIHDISHTAFSHLVDQIYERKDQLFHEDHFERFVTDYSINSIIAENGYDPDRLFDEENFTVLERNLPDLCADRLDYTLRDLYKYGLIDRETVESVLDGLTVNDGVIVAKDTETANKVMDFFLTLNKEVFFNPLHEAANLLLKEILMDAMAKGIISEDDLFTTDEAVLTNLREDDGLQERLERINADIQVEQTENGEYEIMRKHRIVDPLVLGRDARVSEIDASAQRRLEEFKQNVPTAVNYAIKMTQ